MCVDFYYYIRGNNVGSLELYVEHNKGQQDIVWAVGSESGNVTWQHDRISISVKQDDKVRHAAAWSCSTVIENLLSGLKIS